MISAFKKVGLSVDDNDLFLQMEKSPTLRSAKKWVLRVQANFFSLNLIYSDNACLIGIFLLLFVNGIMELSWIFSEMQLKLYKVGKNCAQFTFKF